jgi:uncharacterized protein DUF3987
MAIPEDPEELQTRIETFFKVAFGGADGIVALCTLTPDRKWREYFYQYPDEVTPLAAKAVASYKTNNVYFCPQLLKSRDKPAPPLKSPLNQNNILSCPSAWADLDDCPPSALLVEPSILVESSPNRFQALWVFDEPVAPEVGRQISKNIAYHHVPDGADSGGWDLHQVLRVPFTYNLKRGRPDEVLVKKINRAGMLPSELDVYKETKINSSQHDPMPEMFPTEVPLDILQRYRKSLNPIVFSVFSVEPQEDWSKALWQLQSLCFEAGMSREEVYVVAEASACNKYKRDNKHPRLLWEEVCRAYETSIVKLNIIIPETEKLQDLISTRELEAIDGYETFVERYTRWATSRGDAAKQYHHAAGFMILSALLAGSVRLPTSFGTIMPNLWFMLLADTTLTRKSTAVDFGMEIVDEIDEDILLATDGSLEGLMQSMELRPGKPSVFLRDEVSGLIEAMTKKDYMSGMAEALTKLYDGKTMKRILKRETVTVREPCLLFFAAGIKTRVQSLLTLEHVASGFVPRFCFVTAESDVSKLRPLGPPTEENLEDRTMLVDEARLIRERYVHTQEVILKNQIISVSDARTYAELTEESWQRYNQLEATLLYAGVNHDQPDIMTPVYDRLAKSILKAAVLLAASKAKDDDVIRVELEDLLLAIKYGEGWRKYAAEVINGIGRTTNEVLLQRIYKTIRRHPSITKARLMQWYHLEARQSDIIFETLEQRGLIAVTRMGRTWCYQALGQSVKQPLEG